MQDRIKLLLSDKTYNPIYKAYINQVINIIDPSILIVSDRLYSKEYEDLFKFLKRNNIINYGYRKQELVIKEVY